MAWCSKHYTAYVDVFQCIDYYAFLFTHRGSQRVAQVGCNALQPHTWC